MNQCAYLIIHQIKDVMVSPLFCGSGKAVEVIPPTTMKSSASVEVKMNVDCTMCHVFYLAFSPKSHLCV